MVVELTDADLVILGESLILYKLSLIQTRDAYSNIKDTTFKDNEKLILKSEIDIANEALSVLDSLLNKLKIREDDFH